MNDSVFGKNMENVRKKQWYQICNNWKKKMNYLVSEPNYHNKKFFTETFLATEIKKI